MARKTPQALKLIINGCAGRMGRTLLRLAQSDNEYQLIGGLEQTGAPCIGQDLGSLIGAPDLSLPITDKPADLLAQAHAIIDFTTPESSVALANMAAQITQTTQQDAAVTQVAPVAQGAQNIIHVIGTTGFTPNQEAEIKKAADHITIIKSSNMSLGVNLLANLVQQAATTLQADWDIEIMEMHHKHKIDAPSGTALLLGEAAAKGRGQGLADSAIYTRAGKKGAREKGKIGFASLRGGSVAGEHQVILAGENERLVLGHIAENRDIFARGALVAALWGRTQKCGLFSMHDVLGL
ncbi:MAG: 4-hydroxy-tetrahydrodipicolinate reductase [Alphaproteobacteria bacterium]|nr:4-hydroxy-tetrahydrodipicolinate reductase [Alphaproteobacteria bacterium]